jgi:tetratricopeptide (TPR) repeat protein
MRTCRFIMRLCLALTLWGSAAAGDIIDATMKFSNASERLAQADRARDEGAPAHALTLYKAAMSAFSELTREDRDFQPELVQFRMEHCDSQMEALLEALSSETAVSAPPHTAPASVVEEILELDAMALDTNAVTIRELLVDARRKLEEGEPEAAREQLLKGFTLDADNADLRLLAGLAQCQARRFRDAVFLLKGLADEQPSNATVRVGLSAAYFGTGDARAARQTLEEALAIEPDLKEAHYNMAQLLLNEPEPDLEAVRAHYRRARELGAAPDLRVERALNQ